MKKKLICRLTAGLAAAICMCGCAMSVSAYTPDDVAAKARSAGWPEYLIQAGYNEWSSGNYTQEQVDQAYDSVAQYDDETGQMIANSLGIRYQPGSQSSTETPGSTEPSAEVPAATEPLVVTKTDGTTEERIPQSEFVNMTLEEKQAYVAMLTEESKEAFMDTLSTAERNSIIKQLPAEEKAALVQSYVDAANGMGMNVAVDSIEGNDVSLTIRNDEGQVIGKTAVGTIVDETGISHTGALLGALGAALLAVSGLAFLYRVNRSAEHLS